MKPEGRLAPWLLAVLPACGSTDDHTSAAALRAPVAVTYHPTQPMVVDLSVPLAADGTVAAAVEADPGVRATATVADPTTHDVAVRLRGLAPGAHHDVTVDVTLADGTTETVTVGVDTLDPLPGFVPSFPLTQSGDASDEYLLFDLQHFPQADDGAIFVVDPAGTTRFYLPRPTTLTVAYPVGKVPTAVRLLDDGTISYLQNHDFHVVDELGEERVTVTAEQLGVTSLHHEAIPLPGGRFMALGLEFRTIDYPDETGAKVGGDAIVEFEPDGTVLWTWHAFDHLDPQRRLESFYDSVPDPTTPASPGYDWMHSNALLYTPDDDAILLSVRHLDWLVSIDHATGDVRYRLGRDGDYTLTQGTWFNHQHGPEWQIDGSIMMLDNGNRNPDVEDTLEHSRGVRFTLDHVAKTAAVAWETRGEPYMSPIGGEAYHLDDGNVLVHDSFVTTNWDAGLGAARIRQCDASGDDVWRIDLGDSTASYRSVPLHRLPGEPAPAK